MYEIRFLRKVQSEMEDLSDKDFQKIDSKIQSLSITPRPKRCLKLGEDIYRIRAGNFRIIYHIDDKSQVISIGKVDRRKESTYREIENLFRGLKT